MTAMETPGGAGRTPGAGGGGGEEETKAHL